jgi:hypothetical protein
MADWKPIARLGLGWLLMLAGAALLWDGGTSLRPRSKTLLSLESLGGFVLVVAGWWFRRTATRPNNLR